MAAATKRIVGMDGFLSKIFTFIGTYIFFSMIALSLTHSDPTHSQVYLYAFYQAGIVGGIFYGLNRFTTRANMWEDYINVYNNLRYLTVKNKITKEIAIITGAIPANSGRYVVPTTLVVECPESL